MNQSELRNPELYLEPRKPEIQTPLEFAGDFARSARTSRKRAWAQCMDVETGHAPSIILNSLVVAAARGVDARVVMDQFSEVMINDRIGYIPKHGQEKTRQKITAQADADMFGAFRKNGGEITVTNPTTLGRFFPFTGRNHMKIFIADHVAWFGGVNVASDHFQKADFMVKFYDPRIVGQLAEVFQEVNKSRPDADYKAQINDRYAVLVDKGDRGKSIILEETVRMIGKAEDHIRYVSQLPPSGIILDSLIKQAREGVNVDVLLPSIENLDSNSVPFGFLMKRSYNKFLQKVSGISNVRAYHFNDNEGKVHAKMLTVDGRVALWGSHNLDEAGVKVGTQEVSMTTTDTDLIQGLNTWYDNAKVGMYDLGFQKGPFYLQDSK